MTDYFKCVSCAANYVNNFNGGCIQHGANTDESIRCAIAVSILVCDTCTIDNGVYSGIGT